MALFAAAVAAVIVFFPAEGRLMAPLHEALVGLFGQASFAVPLGLALAGGVCLARRARPDIVLPRRRLVGVGLIALTLLPGERLMGGSTGLVGDWLTGFLLDLLGGPLTVMLVTLALGLGIWLGFAINPRRAARAAR